MGDAFSRWDGFKYYASFSEFLPSVALASILWSIVSVFTAMFGWILLKLFEKACNLIGIEIEIEHLLFYACIFVVSGILVWKGKKMIWPNVQTIFQIKLLVFLLVSISSMFLTWLFRDKAKRWAGVVRESIVPLVWLFSIFVIISVPIVVYSTWFEKSEETVSHETARNVPVDKTRPNIILVTFDALAARNMSVYGYNKETTPFIDKWSENATVFAMAEAASNFTTPAVASLMTGKRVWTHQTYHIAGTNPVRSNIESLPALLKDSGYYNMAFVVNPFASASVLGISNSFDIAPLTSEFGASDSLFGWKFGIIDKMLYRAFGDKIRLHNWIVRNDFIFSKFINLFSRNIYQTTVPPEKVFNKFLEVIDEHVPKPFFAWIHVFPPHDPYLPPEHFKEEVNPSSELKTYKSQEKLIEESYKYLFQYKSYPEKMQPAVDIMRDHYDKYIAYVDKQFEDFIEKYNKNGMSNTLFVLTADHGESFEHGYFTHGGPFLYEQVTQIPLIIKEPGHIKGGKVNALVEQIDIPATILDFANVPVPEWMEGRSLVPLMRKKALAASPAFSMNFEGNRSRGHQITTGSIAVWEGDYKLIYYLLMDESLLFNMKEDPGELINIYDSEPEIGQRLLGLIQYRLNEANKIIRNGKYD